MTVPVTFSPNYLAASSATLHSTCAEICSSANRLAAIQTDRIA